jgi:DNA-binding NarL/FixJ family response regulator
MVQLASANGSTAMSEAVNTKIRVFVVDDHLIIRRGLSLIVKDQQDMVLVGEASDGWEAVESITSMKPDVVLMDIELPGISGVEATKLVGDCLDRSGNPEGTDTYSSLSNREREVLPLLAEGHSHQTIATKLQVSPFTIQTYRQRIMRKLDIHSGTDHLRYALRKGLVSLEA